MTARRRRATVQVLLIAAATLSYWAAYVSAAAAVSASGAAGGRNICDTCACKPDNVAPVAVNCTCAKTKLLILRDQDAELLSSARELTLAGCGFVSFPSSGLPRSASLARVTVRDMKLFHYTAGLFPALESLSVEDVDELVLDGFGPANRTLRHLTIRGTAMSRMVKGTLTAGAPLRSVLLDRVEVDEIESGALDMAFVSVGDNGQADADGFTVVDSKIKSVDSGGITVRSGATKIMNSTLDDLKPGAVLVDDPKGGVWLSGNRLGVVQGDSVSVVRSDADVHVVGNTFDVLPADLQLLRPEQVQVQLQQQPQQQQQQQQQPQPRSVEFVENVVKNVDLGRFLFGVGPTVRVSSNRFVCDCDPRRISVLKLNQVFPGLLPEPDNRLADMLAENYCREPADTTLAGYRDLLVKETVCKGAGTTTTMQPPPAAPRQPSLSAANRGNSRSPGTVVMVTTAVAVTLFAFYCHGVGGVAVQAYSS